MIRRTRASTLTISLKGIRLFVLYILIVWALALLSMLLHLNVSSVSERNSSHEYLVHRLREGPVMADDPWLISYMRSTYLIPPATGAYNLSRTSVQHDMWFQKQKQHGIYKFIVTTFRNEKPGFFVEAGALDGEFFSNTLWLEVEKNWTGLLIEPNPVSCHSLLMKRRKAFFSCSCISPYKYTKETVLQIPHTTNTMEYWLLYANVNSIDSRLYHLQTAINEDTLSSYIPVQCFPLATYLLALNITRVDLLSLDTQGGERSMLRNFPFDKIKVNYILVEYWTKGASPEQMDDELLFIMRVNGFRLIKHFEQHGDYIFGSV